MSKAILWIGCLVAALPLSADELAIKVEWGGGTRAAQLHWDARIEIENGRLLGIENAGLDGTEEGWSERTETAVKLKSMTEGGSDGVRLRLAVTPETRIHFQSPVLSAATTIAEITRSRFRRTAASGAWLTMALAPLTRIATPVMECATIVEDGSGRLWTLGVRNTGDPKLASTRQEAVLGRIVGQQWEERQVVAGPGLVYFTTMTAEPDGNLLLAWSQFDDDSWHVYTARYEVGEGRLSRPRKLSVGRVNLCPALYAGPEGTACAWETDEGHSFTIAVCSRNGEEWGKPVTASLPWPAFRPALAGDGERVHLAFDAFVGKDYDVMACRLENGRPTAPKAVLATEAEEMAPVVCRGADGVVWLSAGGKVVGLRGDRIVAPDALKGGKSPLAVPVGAITCDAENRLWIVGSRERARNRPALSQVGFVSGSTVVKSPPLVAPPTWAPPLIRPDGTLYVLAPNGLFVGRMELPGIAAATPPDVSDTEPSLAKPAVEPRPDPPVLRVGDEEYHLYWGELHTHLTEKPADWTIKRWVDRYYLRSRYEQRMDIGATSDHDWPTMTLTKYMVQQSIASVLNESGVYVACSGFEWSGDSATRKRYGDRTVVFLRDYTPIVRITDVTGDRPQKLHEALRGWGGIDWPHHVGASWATMDWAVHSDEIEPVVEITSGHGVYETYDLRHAIGAWTKTPIGDPDAPVPPGSIKVGKPAPREMIGEVDRTSLQYGLSRGHKFAFVGSSDSHSGLSGFRTGMMGVYARELTREAVFEAWRARRTYALRGGEKIFVDFRINGAPMGSEIDSDRPRVSVVVHGTAPIEKVELIRNNEYIFVREGDGQPDLSFEYVDQRPPDRTSYYYVRVFQQGDSYAWGSPIWVTRT